MHSVYLLFFYYIYNMLNAKLSFGRYFISLVPIKLQQMAGSGKTTLLNSLINRRILPQSEDSLAVTSTVTEVTNHPEIESGRVAWLHQKAVQGTLDVSGKNLDDLSQV